MEIKTMQIAGHQCYSYSIHQGMVEQGIYIYWGVATESKRLVEQTAETVFVSAITLPITLIAYEMPDWNDAFSPWEASPVFGDKGFSGGGRKSLTWLLEKCIPEVEGITDLAQQKENRFLAGYSLAGLFSLWAFYESGQFGGVASCSGSLWYPFWRKYIRGRTGVKGIVYLSLGKKEEKIRHPLMASVGEITRLQYNQMKEDKNIRQSELVYHQGGHFHNIEMRMAQGITWLCKNSKK